MNRLFREKCSHCLKTINIGQTIFECFRCDCIIHSNCFRSSNAEVIDSNFYCNSCKHLATIKYNPFKLNCDDDEIDLNNDIHKISLILDRCKSYTAYELDKVHAKSLKDSSSVYFLNIDGNKSNFDSLTAELECFTHTFSN